MARGWSFYRDFLPVVVLIGNECNDMGLLTLFKAATLQGMNNHVFVAYAYAVATTMLLPVTFFSRRTRVVPPLSFSIITKIVLLGVIGSSSQILGYAGISYSSPTLASSIGNLVPAFTFILAVDILKVFPDELTLVFFYNVTATILSTAVGFFVVPNPRDWKIGLDISLISIVCSGIFGKLMSNVVYAWALHLKGAVYVTSFKPLQVVIAVAMGVMFLDDTLYTGSVVGATIISIGLYTVLWGKATEEIEEDVGSLGSPTAENAPLLQSYITETSEKNV